MTKIAVYYPVGGAMRINGTLYFILKDNLGSSSVVTDASGTIAGEDRFYPYGETRFTTGTMYTDKLFTGQREMTGLGIYHFGARFYSAKLGRFLSADTVVQSYANPQMLNRYSYVLGNPLRYTDPTGHTVACDPYEGDCEHEDSGGSNSNGGASASDYGVEFSGDWTEANLDAVSQALNYVGAALLGAYNRECRNLVKMGEACASRTGAELFRAIFDHITLKWEGSAGTCGSVSADSGGCTDGAHQIRFWSLSGHGQNDLTRMTKNVVHEFGHALDWILGKPSTGMSTDFTRDAVLRPNLATSEGQRWDWQQSDKITRNEIFADMFIAWTYNAWNTDPLNVAAANAAQTWMSGLVP